MLPGNGQHRYITVAEGLFATERLKLDEQFSQFQKIARGRRAFRD